MAENETETNAVVVPNDNNIEKLRKERTNLRRIFTTACNQFIAKQEEEVGGKDYSVLFYKIADKAERLFKVDAQLFELVDHSEKEYDEIESYRDRFVEIKTEYDNSFVQNNSINSNDASGSVNLKLPKIVLKEYDLMPRTWVAFWGQFSRIHQDTAMREEDKFQYLLSSLKPNTKARDIAESYPPSKKNYIKVIEHLESRFGRRDLLIDVFIRDLLTLVNSRANVKLSDLYDKLGSSLRALETLGVTTQNYAAMLYPVVESCLPTDILKAWDRYSLNREVEGEEVQLTKEKLLENLMSFLRREVEGEEHRTLAEKAFGQSNKGKKESTSKDEPTAIALMSSHEKYSSNSECLFCQKQHPSQDCWKASSMKLNERINQVKQKKCCLVCLKRGHIARSCRSAIRCLVCNQRHYVLLCPDLKSNNVKPLYKEINQEIKPQEANSTSLFASESTVNLIYLKTVMLRLRHKETQIEVRALLDDGSHRSYIETKLALELGISPDGIEVLSQGLFGGRTTPSTKHRRFTVIVEGLNSQYSASMSFLEQNKICTTLPRVRDQRLLSEISARGINLTDVGNGTPPIRVLLGADVLGSILTGRIEVFRSGISAIETLLGWCILGGQRKNNVIEMVTVCMQNFEIPKIWELESLGIVDPIKQKDTNLLEEETLTHFQETIKKKDGRYEVSLPWLAGHPSVYNKQDVAEARLRSVTKRLLKEGLYKSYDNVFKQWEKDGIIELVPSEDMLKASHYLPHRPVVKLSSSTTKIRPVFDASFKRPGYASLNECLSVGPSLSQQIVPLLLRYRLGALGVIADIRQAFLQISIRKEDRDFLRFLWWSSDNSKELKYYRHCRVVFGVTSSPFLLNASIAHHLNSEAFKEDDYQTTIEKLKLGFYVDNLTTSVESEEELTHFKSQALEIMNAGSFELRSWAHNGVQDMNDQSVLGLKWNLQTDELYCACPSSALGDDEIITKRKLLSIVNSVFDPIGFTAPATLLPKLLLQEAWRKKIEWDEELPPDMQLQYKRWAKHIDLVESCKLPRRLIQGTFENATLHIFTDASAQAYACCAFLRSDETNEVKVSLVMAKARVAPVERPTIPRLELLGAAIGARMAATILETLKLPLKTYLWTDSMIVLSWITNQEPWNTFIGNRVKEIRKLTNMEDWRHVPGSDNPSDLPSRSCNWSELLQSHWWEGPEWLRKHPEDWPNSEIILPDEALLERRKTVISSLNVDIDTNFGKRFLYFSNYMKILRMTAWMLRFIHNAKNKSSKMIKELPCEEIEKAEEVLIKIVQTEWPTETCKKYSQSIQFFEENKILKIKSRLVLGDGSEDFIRPIVLPDHPIVRRKIEHVHRKLQHAGVQTTLTSLRERYWIPRGRRVVREVLNKCVICKRHSSKPAVPSTPAPLPIERINCVSAFEVIGADLAGPLNLKGNVKSWIVIFTCAVYRAVHLELVTSLSTESFMQALRRFISRRGRCSIIYTDNGTNFVGAARALQSLDWSAIESECAMLKIKWKFNPPAAPWYGGWWERMIRSIKHLLKKSLGRACVTFEEMSTLLCECESTINSRPLTYLSDDPNEPKALKPSDFIQDIKCTDTVDLDIIDSKSLCKRIRYIQSLRQQFRKRFQEEYLAELIRHPQLSKKRLTLVPGDIVLIGTDNAKRINWPLGRILELFPGKDNVQRVVRLRTANGELIRPIQRIFPLEISFSEIPENIAKANIPDSSTDEHPTVCNGDKTVTRESPKATSPELPRTTRCGRNVVTPKRLDL